MVRQPHTAEGESATFLDLGLVEFVFLRVLVLIAAHPIAALVIGGAGGVGFGMLL